MSETEREWILQSLNGQDQVLKYKFYESFFVTNIDDIISRFFQKALKLAITLEKAK